MARRLAIIDNRTPTAAWLAEQEAKQAAYAARRRAWTHTLARRAMPEADAVEEAAEPPVAEGGAANQASHTGKQRRPRGGLVHDSRQGRFAF